MKKLAGLFAAGLATVALTACNEEKRQSQKQLRLKQNLKQQIKQFTFILGLNMCLKVC